jgi:hydroxymethylpyrimidine pyrophosphatase-like HAD family hydrolase
VSKIWGALQLLGVDKDTVIGVGDTDNDLPLFESVGFKIAMANGTEKLKRSADYIAPSVDEDGLAFIIDMFLNKVSDGREHYLFLTVSPS